MKKLFIYAAIVAAAMGGMTSCSDFLNVEPAGKVSEPDFLTQSGVIQLMTGMYATLHDYTGSDYWQSLSNYVYGDIMGGSANKGSNFTDQPDFTSLETYTFTTDNSYLNNKWRSCYTRVFMANNVINVANKGEEANSLSTIAGESKDFLTETIAQARFFRAFWHFEAVKIFGAAIPYVTDKDLAENVNPQVSNVDESGNYIYIWDKIAEDFQYAYENLPDTWSTDKGRANKWAAAAFLAKLRIYQSSPYNGTNGTSNHWAEAKTILEDVMTNGKDNNGTKYQLAENYEKLYLAGESDWTGESVFDIQMAISGTQTNTNAINGAPHVGFQGALGTGGWGFYQPSYDMVNSHIVNESGLPEMNNAYQNVAPLTTIDDASVPHTDLTVYTDPRLDFTVGRFNVPYWDWSIPVTISGWIRELSNGGPYLHKKNIPRKADQGSLSVSTESASSAKNFHLIRYADVLLWYAETLIETGKPQEAGQYINQIRERAAKAYVHAADETTMAETTSSYIFDNKISGTQGVNAAANYRIGLYPASQFATKESATKALRWERKIEMALEGHRWFDLVRWNIAADELNNFVSYESKYLGKYINKYYNPKWATLPIPQKQTQLMNGILVQNENWK